MRGSSIVSAAFGLLACATTVLGAEPMVGGTLYRLTIASDTKFINSRTGPGGSLYSMSYDFRAAREGDRVELAVDRIIHTTTSRNSGETNRTEMTRSTFVHQPPKGQATVTDRATTKPDLVSTLDQFEAPFAVLTLDDEGGEIRRELKAGAGFDGLDVDILRAFSPKFPRDKAEWDIKPRFFSHEVPKGTLHYAKRPAAKPGGPIEVDVSGTLTLAGRFGEADIKSGRSEVKGVQTYDPALREWVAGKLTITKEIESANAGGETRSIRTTTVVTLVRQDGPDGEKAEGKESP